MLACYAERLSTVEFRDRSWFDDAVFDALRRAGAAPCIAHSERLSTAVERTASYAYLRPRRGDYDARALGAWAARLSGMAARCEELYVYLKHEQRAPGLSLSLREMLRGAIQVAG
jgi:uncharacterized protein YecE (DUF72 family)